MRSTPHILVINGTKVRRPVFVLGAPHSGTDLLARALERAPGLHVTAGRPEVLRVTYAFARRPAIATERGQGAARVLRDAYAEAWRVSEPRGVNRFADASPDLLYSADVLLDAFPDAQLLQVIRDGRDVVAGMLADERCLAWFRPGFANLAEVFPNPFLGVEEEVERERWPAAAAAVKCALRWRGSVRLSARLRAQTPDEQLLSLRYEDLAARPRAVAETVSGYLGAAVPAAPLAARPAGRADRLTARQLMQVERVAGTELRRMGYRLSVAE